MEAGERAGRGAGRSAGMVTGAEAGRTAGERAAAEVVGSTAETLRAAASMLDETVGQCAGRPGTARAAAPAGG